jgi:hypothetical protein
MAERLLDEHDDDAAHTLALDRWRDAEGRGDWRDAEFWLAVVASIEHIIVEDQLGRDALRAAAPGRRAPSRHDGGAP